jgi:hypothetical protein
VVEPSISIRIFDGNNTMVACLSMAFDRKGVIFEKDDYIDCHVPSFPFMPNLYYLQIKITVGVLIDMVNNAATFKVSAPHDVVLKSGNMGIAFTDAKWCFHNTTIPRQIPVLVHEMYEDDH